MALHPWHDVELPRFAEEPIPAIIEIPTGSKVKYELDKATGLLIVDRVLFSSVHYPANYGFVPRTYCDDGDPLDILVYCQEPIVPLSIMRAKVIGVMKMRDDKGEDDKLIAVHIDDPEYADYSDLSEMPSHRMRELKRFFEDYKALERKRVLVSEPQGRREALMVLRDAIRLYDELRDLLIGRQASGRRAGDESRAPSGRKAVRTGRRATGKVGRTGARATTRASGKVGRAGSRATTRASGEAGRTGARATTRATGEVGRTGARATGGASPAGEGSSAEPERAAARRRGARGARR